MAHVFFRKTYYGCTPTLSDVWTRVEVRCNICKVSKPNNSKKKKKLQSAKIQNVNFCTLYCATINSMAEYHFEIDAIFHFYYTNADGIHVWLMQSWCVCVLVHNWREFQFLLCFRFKNCNPSLWRLPHSRYNTGAFSFVIDLTMCGCMHVFSSFISLRYAT